MSAWVRPAVGPATARPRAQSAVRWSLDHRLLDVALHRSSCTLHTLPPSCAAHRHTAAAASRPALATTPERVPLRLARWTFRSFPVPDSSIHRARDLGSELSWRRL